MDDLIAAADFMRDELQAPTILVGHSLGGAAVLAAAGRIDEVRGVATIGAPSDPLHVIHNFQGSVEAIERDGEADVVLGFLVRAFLRLGLPPPGPPRSPMPPMISRPSASVRNDDITSAVSQQPSPPGRMRARRLAGSGAVANWPKCTGV